MLFNSFIFLLVFLPATLIGFALAGRWFGSRGALAVLAGASLIFYGWWDVRLLPLLLASVAGNFALGLIMDHHRRRTGQALSHFFVAGVMGNLSLIAWFKYAGFFSDNIAWVTGFDPGWRLALPLGISFFTFQQIAYLGRINAGSAAESSPLRYLVFITFFAHLIAGPIVHPAEILPQLAKIRTRLVPWNLVMGGSLFAVGLAKKVLLADTMARFAAPGFAVANTHGVPDLISAWSATLGYTLQIYFDFSGYSDMAMGLALLFGLRFPVNFFSPYKATSIIEFWRRWHMSLSLFLRDYVYIPMGGNAKGTTRRHFNLMATMLIGGLWHGASWTFVAWGGVHGFYLVVNHLWRRLFPAACRNGLGRLCGWALTFFATMMAWVLFRTESMGAAWAMYQGLFGQGGVSLPSGLLWRLGGFGEWLARAGVHSLSTDTFLWLSAFPWLLLGMVLVLLAPNSVQLFRSSAVHDPDAAHPCLSWHATGKWAVAVGVLAGAALLQLGAPSEFIYFNF